MTCFLQTMNHSNDHGAPLILMPLESIADRERAPGAGAELRGVKGWLGGRPPVVVTVWAMAAAFTAYGSMYAFRKPFAAAGFPGTYWGLDYKGLLVLAQLVGYTVSKFLGIKIVSEATPARRSAMVLGLIGFAEAALVLFALVPPPWNMAFLFLNGLPLGMVWGLVFGFLEGRRVTEFMALGLSLSLIFASGWVKAAGLFTMASWRVSQFWMPAITGALFVPLLLAAMWMLSVLPPPNAADIAARSRRQPMDRAARRAFLREHWLGVSLLVAGYMGLMTYRDVRDTFQVDILREFGAATNGGQLAGIETWVGIAVIVAMGLFALFRSNRSAFFAGCALIAAGGVLSGVSTAMLQAGTLSPRAWMVATGIGLYAAFIPYQSILFERLLAMLRTAGTAAFLISICDSYGYLSTISLYFYKEFGASTVSWGHVLTTSGYAVSALMPLAMFGAVLSFARTKAWEQASGGSRATENRE